MKVDHIGYAVKKIEKAIESFELLGYQFGEVIDDNNRNIKICFGIKDGYKVELIQPIDKMKESPVDNYLSKIGATAYHICYVSQDFEKDIADLTSKGFKIVIPAQEAIAFQNKRVIFMMNLAIGLIEIVEG